MSDRHSSLFPIMLYDGECGFCNRSAMWLFHRDKRGVFKFAPLQGETANELLTAEERENLKTVVIQTEAGQFRFSSAIVQSLWILGGLWWVTGWLLWLIPRPIRDCVYRTIALHRHRLPSPQTCEIVHAPGRFLN